MKLVLLEGGERLPFFLGADGVPLFYPMVWLLTMRRSANAATATLRGNLFALKLLYLWSDSRQLDLEGRMLAGDYLTKGECASLVDAARRPLVEWTDRNDKPALWKPLGHRIKSRPLRATAGASEIDRQTAGIRVRTIIDYLAWLADEGINTQDRRTADLRLGSRAAMVGYLKTRTPKDGGRNVLGKREAPPQAVIDALLKAVELDSPENPWSDLGLKARNRLLIYLLLGLGIRRGEALGIRVDRIDFQGNRILIARNADDPLDPRVEQPLTKTRDRWLPLKDTLVGMIQEYVTHVRAKMPKARRHPFLFVSHRDGDPLALVSVNRLFQVLRERVDGLPENLSPHMLRHAWNDAFSRAVDQQKISPEREQQIRSEMMGWSPTSGTAATYTRRHIRQAAEIISIKHQEQLIKRK